MYPIATQIIYDADRYPKEGTSHFSSLTSWTLDADEKGQANFGPSDQLSTWHKPKTRPQGLSKEEFSALPKTLTLREVHYYICIPGFRTKQVTLITTLLNAEVYSWKELLKIYEFRWQVELDLKHIKTTLGMDVLWGKTPDMVRKEIYVHLLGYNLLRTVMGSAGITYEVHPLRLSLQGARQHLDNFREQLASAGRRKRQRLYGTLLELIAHKPVPERVGRSEPRVRKGRPKSYPVMQQPRESLRRQLKAA